jgi:polyphosphate kinase
MLNRELGILAFNERVLAQAEDPSVPLLERLRYLTIVSGNLDEFFEVRVAELRERALSGNPAAEGARASLAAIAERTRRLVSRQYRLLNETLIPAMAAEGIVFQMSAAWSEAQQRWAHGAGAGSRLAVGIANWTDAQRRWADEVFRTEIEPLLTPIALDPAHPFPRVLNKSLNFVIELDGEDAFGRRAGLAVVQAPRTLPRVLRVPEAVSGVRDGLALLSAVVLACVDRLFPGLTVRAVHQFRVTRNSELFVDDEEITDLRAALQGELPQRHYGDAVRLEVSSGCTEAVIARLLTEFELSREDCYRVEGPVNLARLSQVIDLVDRDDLKFPRFVPATRHTGDLFAAIRKSDLLLHHPYESFEPVMAFLSSAATDPRVVAIKLTVYRTGADSVLMEALVEAARAGKEVTVVLELMARFDEEANINWAARLEQVGAHVVYGVVGLKTHAKMALLVRREGNRLQRYIHLGTGNYHPRTARLYEDFGLLSADEELCADVHEVFRRLTGVGQAGPLRALLQAPFTLHETVLASIRRETANARAGRRGYIAAKVNALLEPMVIEALYEASAAGVKIDLIVRGVCALQPGVPGLSENIRVRSIVGRFLEHSRVYVFWNDGLRDVWLASADWMDRNLLRRVEVAFPVRDRRLKQRVLREAIEEHLKDNASAWVMDAEGGYTRRKPHGARRVSQMRLLEALTAAERSPRAPSLAETPASGRETVRATKPRRTTAGKDKAP